MKNFLAGLLILVTVQGCAVWTARSASLETKAYALESDYVAIQGVAARYIVRPDADPWAKISIKSANRRASQALNISGDMARGIDLDFCVGDAVLDVPDSVDSSFAALACADDMPAVLTRTATILAVLNSIIIELEAE